MLRAAQGFFRPPYDVQFRVPKTKALPAAFQENWLF